MGETDFRRALAIFDDFPEHKRLVSAAFQLLAEDDRVTGFYLSGSFADGNPDRYSDIDLNIVVPADQREQIIEDHQALIHQVGRVATLFPALHLHLPELIIVFYDEAGFPVHVDYVYRTPDDVRGEGQHHPMHIVFDRDGSLARWRQANPYTPPDHRPTAEKLQYFEDRFWGWTWYTAPKVERGELWEARTAIEEIRSLVLLTLAYYQTGLRHKGNRRLETKFPPPVLNTLSQSIPTGVDQAAYRQALIGLIDGYIDLMDAVLATDPALQIRQVDRDFFLNAIKR